MFRPGDPNDQLTIIQVPYPCQCLTITNLPTGQNYGCNGSNSVPTDTSVLTGVNVLTNCCSLASLVATHVDTNNGCSWTRTFTITATDQCSNTISTNVVFTWTANSTGPVFTSVPAGGNLGCNPTNIPTVGQSNVTAVTSCGDTPVISISHMQSTTGCLVTSTYLVTASDACSNTTSTNVVYTWTSDTTTPTLSVSPGANLGCNPTSVPTNVQYTASDSCGNLTQLPGELCGFIL